MKTSKYIILGCLVIGIALGLGIVYAYFRSPADKTQYVTEAMPSIPESSPLPVITAKSQDTETSWPSPDGRVLLKMMTKPADANQTAYSFFVANSATESGSLVFTQKVNSNTTFAIPFNTWSPDNKEFYIQERAANQVKNYAFKASGASFPGGEAFLDVNTLFEEKKTGFIFGEVTGWAAPTLLIVNTKSVDPETAEQKMGPSFWFETSRKSVTRLSNTFP